MSTASSRRYYLANKDKVKARNYQFRADNPDWWRERHLRNTFGITVAEYDKMLKAQDGRCAICGRVPRTRRLAVDHSHTTGTVLGLLCSRCNRGLGPFEHNTEVLKRAIMYMRKIIKDRENHERREHHHKGTGPTASGTGG